MDYGIKSEGSFEKPDEDESSMNPNDFLSFAVDQMLNEARNEDVDEDTQLSFGDADEPEGDDVLIDEVVRKPAPDSKPKPTLASILAQNPDLSFDGGTTPWSTANPPANFGPIRSEISEFRPRTKAGGAAFRKGPRNVLHRRRLVYQDVDERFETPEDFKRWWDGGACAGWVYNSTYRTQMDEEIRVFRCSVKFCPHRIRVAYNINTKAVRVEISTIGHQHSQQAKDEVTVQTDVVPLPKSEIEYADSQATAVEQPKPPSARPPPPQAAASAPRPHRMPAPPTSMPSTSTANMMTPSRAVPPQPRRHPPQPMMPSHQMRPQMPPHLFQQRPMLPPICPEYRQKVEQLVDVGLSAKTIHMALMEETIRRIPTVDQIEMLIRMKEAAAANAKEPQQRRSEPDPPKYAPSMAVLHQNSPTIPFSNGGSGFPTNQGQQKFQNNSWMRFQ